MMAAWLPVFTGAALASVACKDASKTGHSHAAAHSLASAGEYDTGGGPAGATDDCGGCDLCYSHCTLSLPAVGNHYDVSASGSIAQAGPAPLSSLSHPPADRPPLSHPA